MTVMPSASCFTAGGIVAHQAIERVRIDQPAHCTGRPSTPAPATPSRPARRWCLRTVVLPTGLIRYTNGTPSTPNRPRDRATPCRRSTRSPACRPARGAPTPGCPVCATALPTSARRAARCRGFVQARRRCTACSISGRSPERPPPPAPSPRLRGEAVGVRREVSAPVIHTVTALEIGIEPSRRSVEQPAREAFTPPRSRRRARRRAVAAGIGCAPPE